ncbi:putative serine/threonine protein phosphatase PP1 [Aspergillus keveii]|uniref:Serine/threonine-protein phosphatase n=1 Tax=Aspergillus keveii TaxID=714993 RepID=A0ABR4G268_9EURO
MSTPPELNLDATISRLLQVGSSRRIPQPFCLEPAEISAICSAASNVLLAEPSLLEITAPVTIVGDIHGQYTDLLRVFDRCGFPDTTHYLFLGNYVSKGRNSLETILLLLCYKIKYPQTFFLLRGNHECASITRMSLFYSECKYRCKVNVWRTFRTVKNSFPIAATVSGKFFCVHGGLSPSLTSLDDIRAIARPTDVSDTGLLTDLLWSDPADVDEDWTENDRAVSYYFNKRVTRSFLQHTGLAIICRGHTVVDEGYKFDFDNTLVTIFSAPKHHDDLNNSGAVMNISADLSYSFETFEALDPYTRRREVLPGDQPSQPEGEAQGPLHGVPFAPDF